jgi:hypothetical protein
MPNAQPAPVSTEKPTAAMILSIIGGIFILLGGLLGVAIGSTLGFITFGFAGGTILLLGAIGTVIGILTVVFGILLSMHTGSHTMYGALIIVFSIVSWITAFGGFFIGFLLALIGGILAITFKPTPPAVMWAQPVQRVCPKCGRVVDPNVKFCPSCGNPLG